MPARSTWKGYLKLSLVSIPVKAYSASRAAGNVPLHQLHAQCNSRIKYKKVCPLHGEVPKEEIVSGYEHAKGQYVVIDSDELAGLREKGEREITIDAVVAPRAVDPIYYTDKSYYLIPDGAIGQKPYALLQQALESKEQVAVAHGVLFGRDEIVLLRPIDGLLALTALKYEAEVTHAQTFFEELTTPELSREELGLTQTLLQAFTKKKFSLAGYKDQYLEKLTEIVEAKVEGKELVTPPPVDQPKVINLMDALKKSLAKTKRGDEKPSRHRLAPSTKKQPVARARRKTG
ncbi:MAG: Ku protein [Pirellulaceae bacterium]|nr:Ku protein [Pirellulaceae bacterium]